MISQLLRVFSKRTLNFPQSRKSRTNRNFSKKKEKDKSLSIKKKSFILGYSTNGVNGFARRSQSLRLGRSESLIGRSDQPRDTRVTIEFPGEDTR